MTFSPATAAPVGSVIKFTVLALCMAGSVAGLVALRNANTRLYGQIADVRARNRALADLREDSQRTRQWLALAEAGDEHAAATIHAELTRTMSEVRTWEQRAAEQYALKLRRGAVRAGWSSPNGEAMAGNRDPEKGPTRLEYFQNVGRATPAAAFQTMIWAAVKGDDTALGNALALSDDARAEAASIQAALPPAERARYSTPEKLVALFVAGAIVEHASAAQILEQTTSDSRHATVSVGVAGAVDETKWEFQLGETGWQLTVPESVIAGIKKKLGDNVPSPPAS